MPTPFSNALECAAVCAVLSPLIPGHSAYIWEETRVACDVACANKYLSEIGATDSIQPPARRER